jgi:hypothetical protein
MSGKSAGPAAAPGPLAPFWAIFDREFAPNLGPREASFRIMLETLALRARGDGAPLLVVETGSMREENGWLDGQSTALWATFARYLPCEVHTVDLNADAAALVRRICGDQVQTHTEDSVGFLHRIVTAPQARQIDLLYLDSFDFDPRDPFPSAMHHVKELIAARPCLAKGSIVAIDDNFYNDQGQCVGKGYLAMQWFEHLRIPFLHKGYQVVWQL